MDTLSQSQVFFLISSVGFIVFGVLVVILLFYLIRISRIFSRIIDKAEEDINNIGDTTWELLEELRESGLFRLFIKFFRKSNKGKKSKKKKK